MSEDKLGFYEFDSLFRFEFTGTSLAWGATVGLLLSCHKYSKSSINYLGQVKESLLFGGFFAFVTASAIWGYHLYKFTISRHVIQQQNYARQESALKVKFVESYFKSKYHMEDSSPEQISLAINDLDEKWRHLEAELSSEEVNK